MVNESLQELSTELLQARALIDACISELNLPADWLSQVESGTYEPPPSYGEAAAEHGPPPPELIMQMNAMQRLLRARVALPPSTGGSHLSGGVSLAVASGSTAGLQRGLRRLQRRTGSLLPEMELRAGEVHRVGNRPVAGQSRRIEVWEGEYLGGEKVAIKVLCGAVNNEETMKRFKQEVTVWRKLWDLDHGRHILPFYGWCQTDGPNPYFVSPWQYQGTALTYVLTNPDSNIKKLILGIAEGVALLHTAFDSPIVHGNLRAENVVIGDFGRPLLADFGVAQLADGLTGVAPMCDDNVLCMSARWQAAELICEEEKEMTTCSDVWSLGMTILELITGRRPFDHLRQDAAVIIAISGGERPARPTDEVSRKRGLNDELWSLLSDGCWNQQPQRRPSAQQVVERLKAWQDQM